MSWIETQDSVSSMTKYYTAATYMYTVHAQQIILFNLMKWVDCFVYNIKYVYYVSWISLVCRFIIQARLYVT